MSNTLVATQTIDRIFIYGFIGYSVTTNDTDVTLSVESAYGASYDEASESGTLTYSTKLDIYVDNSLWKSVTVGYIDYQTLSYTKSFPRSETKTHTLMLKASVYGNTTSKSTTFSVSVRTYSVTYNANGGSGAPSSQTKIYSKSLTLSSTRPTRPRYAFKRWNTNTSDTGTAYSPGASYTGNANLALYAIWNPVIAYDANGGTGAPGSQTKTYGTALTLSSTTPTRTGYTFIGWNTAVDGSGTNYAAGASYTSNDAATLYAKWSKDPERPTISTLTVVRSDANGNAKDDGTYCKVTAQWSIDTTNVSGNTAIVTGTIRPEGGSAAAITFSSGASGTSGTAQALVGGCDTDKQYTITVTVTDTKVGATSRTAIMTRAFFVLDLKAGGTAMGIGSAAPSSGLEVGWAVQFDQAVSMLLGLTVGGNLTVTGDLIAPQLTVESATSSVATAGTNWAIASQVAYTYGKVVLVCVKCRPTMEVSADSSSTICTLASDYRPKADQGFCDSQGIGTVSSGGSCSYRNLVALSTSSTVTVGLAFIKS